MFGIRDTAQTRANSCSPGIASGMSGWETVKTVPEVAAVRTTALK